MLNNSVAEKQCLFCNKPFVASKKNARFCSTNCWQIHKRRLAGVKSSKNLTGACQDCQTPIDTGKRGTKRLCSDCKLSRRLKFKKTCPVCNVEFKDAENKRKYCSIPCKAKGTSTKRKFACCECGIEVTVGANRPTAKYCSKSCEAKSRVVPKELRECLWCKQKFAINPKRQVGSFCSRKCLGHHSRTHASWSHDKRSSLEIAVAQALTTLAIPYKEQVPIGPWLADFLLTDQMTVLEADGIYYHSLPRAIARDRSRDAHLRAMGYRVIRLGEKQIKKDALFAVRSALTL